MSCLCLAVALSIAALMLCLSLPCSPHDSECRMMAFVVDRPIVTYPEYRQLMLQGEVDVVRGEMSAHLVKSELGWRYLQILGIAVKAE